LARTRIGATLAHTLRTTQLQPVTEDVIVAIAVQQAVDAEIVFFSAFLRGAGRRPWLTYAEGIAELYAIAKDAIATFRVR
jgi:hypothetical protein